VAELAWPFESNFDLLVDFRHRTDLRIEIDAVFEEVLQAAL
jgi:hypothetical protein